jgi:hypothetical protein
MGTTLACTGHTPQLQQQILGTPDGLSTGARTLRRESCMAAVKFFAGHHPETPDHKLVSDLGMRARDGN